MSSIQSSHQLGNEAQDLVSHIQSSAFFRHLTSDEMEKVSKLIEVVSIKAGQNVLTEGHENYKLYFLLEGSLGVYVKGEKVSTLKRTGDVVGEISLISREKASATVVAEVDCKLMCFDMVGARLEAPELILEIENSQHKIFATLLAQRLVETNDKARKFEMTNRELVQAKEAVEKMNSDLELRVAQRTHELSQKNLELEKALNDNRQLVRVLCHDLNNTQAVVHLTATAAVEIGSAWNSDQHVKFWEKALRAANKERDLIQYVKDLVALEAGKTQLELVPVDLEEVIDSAVFLFEDRLAEKGISIKVDSNLKYHVMAEPVSLANSVINNLISNAIKFTPAGKVIHVLAREIEGQKVEVVVQDEGIGMPKAILENLFSMTAKTSRQGTAGESGTGFGMPLVKTTMQAYGGDIVVSSEEFAKANESTGTRCALVFKKAK
jgi:signal transduction histidine kinase